MKVTPVWCLPNQQQKQIKQVWLIGLWLNEMGLEYIANVFMNMFQPKERKAQQEIISDVRIIFESDGNSESVNHVEARDQPKSFTATILQFRSSQNI